MGRYVVLEGGALADVPAVVRESDDVQALTVADRESAVAAVLAAVRGADLVVSATANRDVIDQLCDDLRRLGTVEHRVEPQARAMPLSADEHDLLAALLGGATLGEAAAALHLSRRTADRRLAAARRALGAGSTAEALVLAAQAGVKPR